eukprot:9566442-Ditylum_brightwellii.AAC.1
MEAENISESAISAFESTFNSLAKQDNMTCTKGKTRVSGATGIIAEDTISPVDDLIKADDLTTEPNTDLLSETVVLKLNGGLGT